jgi:hypothetical protein
VVAPPTRTLAGSRSTAYNALGEAGPRQAGRLEDVGPLPVDLSSLTIGTKYTRPELAKRWGYASHAAFSGGVFTPKGQNLIILFVTRIKQGS